MKELLRTSIVHSINNHVEFKYLEELCYRNHTKFNEKTINYCLDRYIELRKQKEAQFKSKYASIWKTAWGILTKD